MSFTEPAAWRAGALIMLAVAASGGGARSEEVALLPPVLGASERYLADRRSGVALSGVDPVSYFVDGRPRLGDAVHELVWEGLAWRFRSAANRAAFLRDPEAFLPRLGGYDAAGAAAGAIVGADPFVHALVDGRLYLFRTDASRVRFLADRDLPARAEERWRDLGPGLPGG